MSEQEKKNRWYNLGYTGERVRKENGKLWYENEKGIIRLYVLADQQEKKKKIH